MLSKQDYFKRIEEFEVEFTKGNATWADFNALCEEIDNQFSDPRGGYYDSSYVLLVDALMNLQCRLEEFKEQEEFINDCLNWDGHYDMDGNLPF